MKIIDCKQGSSEWFAARCGVVTASEVDALVTPLLKLREGKSVESYVAQKVAEKLLGYTQDQITPKSFAMDQGSMIEKIARPWYAFDRDVDVATPGFCLSDDGKCGCSPDGLVGEDGGLEIKAPYPETHVRYLLAGRVPDDYVCQVRFSLWVTGREWWDFVSFRQGLPELVVRTMADDKANAVFAEAMRLFNERFDAALAKIETLRAVVRATERAAKL